MEKSPRLEQLPVAHQSLEYLIEKHGPNLHVVLVNSIVESMREELTSLLERNELLHELRDSQSGRDHLIVKLSEQVALMGGNTLMSDVVRLLDADLQACEEFDMELRKAIRSLRSELDGSAQDLSDDDLFQLTKRALVSASEFATPGTSAMELLDAVHEHPRPFVQLAMKRWYDYIHSYAPLQEQNTRSSGEGMRLPNGDMMPDQAPALISVMRRQFPLRMRRHYDVVRTADYRDAQLSDVQHVAEMYNSALLRESTLSLLLPRPDDTEERIQKRTDLVRKRVEKGTLINPMDPEELENLLSGSSLDERGVRFKLKLLVTDDPSIVEARGHGILAFGSFDDTPPKGYAHVRRKTMLDYLRRGMSGGRVAWTAHVGKFLKRRTKNIIESHDMRSTYPLAMYRLGALGFQDMMRSHGLEMDDPYDEDKDPYVIACRLLHFSLESDVPLIRRIDRSGLLLENDHSFHIMREWAMFQIGIDSNKKKEGDHIRQYDVDGVGIDLNASWEIVGGPLPRVAHASRNAWRKKQIEHGDVSDDTLDML